MAYDRDFGEWVREHLAALGPLEIKRFFGGAGVYSNGLIFGLLDDGVIWLKADETSAAAMQGAGSHRFTFDRNGEIIGMDYWSLPDSAVDDPDEAVVWARTAIEVSRRKSAAKKPRRPGKPSAP